MTRCVVVSLAAIAGAALAGCSSSSAPDVATLVVAGEFVGPVIDSVAGQETGDLVLAQHGVNLGGSMTLAAGAVSTVESVALTLSGTSLTGSGVMDVNGAACTFAIKGAFGNGAITATYTGVSGCTQTGSWSLTQTCTGTAASVQRRTDGFIPRC